MLYTVAIPAYNRCELLKESLKELVKQVTEIGSGEILLVDDGSNDLTPKLLDIYSKRHNFFHYIISNENNGISKTRNMLVKNAKGKYIIFLDSDVFITENLIKNHLEILTKNEKVICQSNLILSSKIDNQPKANFLTDNSKAFFDTANVSLEKRYLVKAGYFDENFSAYGWEDLEMGLRLKQQGLKQIKNKNIYAYHYQPAPELNKIDSYIQKEKDRAKGAIYFSKKHNLFEVKTMTQIYKITRTPLLKFYELYGLNKIDFIKKLEIFKEKDYNKFIFLFRMYMNYFYLRELEALLKQK